MMTAVHDAGAGEPTTIRYETAETSLGALLVGATARGVCWVGFGEPATLIDELRARFPRAACVRDGRAIQAWIDDLAEAVERPSDRPAPPVDAHGTAFQWRVWRRLQTIPTGERRTYAELAASLGQPSAARAVARACAGNPTALAVPCHRVVRASGELGGYRWGVERKRILLARERAAVDADRTATTV